MNDYLERLLDLLFIHDGHCSIVDNSNMHTEATKLRDGGCVTFRSCSMSGMLEVHFTNRTRQTNRKALLTLRDELRKQDEN